MLALAALIWHGSTEIAAGRGVRGPWQQNESRYDFVDDPTVKVDASGELLLAWVDQGAKDVFFQRMDASGKRITDAVNISRSPKVLSWLPRVATDRKGNIFILWQEIIFSGGSHGGDILFSRSSDAGKTFSEPLNLSRSVAGDGKGRIDKDRWHNGSLDLVVGADGVIHAAWTEYEGALWARRSTDGGNTFSHKMRIADAKPARAPSLAVGGDAVYLAWTVGDDAAADVRVAKSVNGDFGAPVIIGKSKAYSDAPKIALDGKGTLHLAYADDRRILYSRSSDGARTFEPPREIAPRSAGFPSIDIDGKDNIYVLFDRFNEHRFLARGLGIAVSTDAGATFRTGDVPGSVGEGWNGSSQGLLMRKLAVGRDGAVAVVNSSLKENERSRVWLMRGKLRAD